VARRKAVDVGEAKAVAEASENGKRNTKAKDQKDEYRHSRLGKSSDGRAKTHQNREEGKAGRSCLAIDEARRRVFICKADSRQYKAIILRA